MHTFFCIAALLVLSTLGVLAAPHSLYAARSSPGQRLSRSSTPLSRGMINTTLGACLPSGNSTSIQSLLVKAGDAAILCPGSTFDLYAPVNFTAPNQILTTLGAPTNSSRALLTIRANFTTAIQGSCDQCSGATLSHIQVNGNRAQLGRPPRGGAGLIEMGGNTNGQRIEYVRSFDPRGFSCMHVIEGAGMSCRNATVVNNDIGPCGESAETDFPQAALNGTGRSFADGIPGTISSDATSGKWADGLSMACPYSLVANNTITDASDGGIVIFGAFGSTIESNHVLALNQTLLGGINLVDSTPSKNYTGVMVMNNLVEARGDMIKVGIGCGPAVWGDDLKTRNFGATVMNNTLAGPYMGYGILLSGVANWTAHGNVVAPGTNFSASLTEACHGLAVEPAAIVMDPSTVEIESLSVQSGVFGPAQFAICIESERFVKDLEYGIDDDEDVDDDLDEEEDEEPEPTGGDTSCWMTATTGTWSWTGTYTSSWTSLPSGAVLTGTTTGLATTVTSPTRRPTGMGLTPTAGGMSSRGTNTLPTMSSSSISSMASPSTNSASSSPSSSSLPAPPTSTLPSNESAPAMGGGFEPLTSSSAANSTFSSITVNSTIGGLTTSATTFVATSLITPTSSPSSLGTPTAASINGTSFSGQMNASSTIPTLILPSHSTNATQPSQVTSTGTSRTFVHPSWTANATETSTSAPSSVTDPVGAFWSAFHRLAPNTTTSSGTASAWTANGTTTSTAPTTTPTSSSFTSATSIDTALSEESQLSKIFFSTQTSASASTTSPSRSGCYADHETCSPIPATPAPSGTGIQDIEALPTPTSTSTAHGGWTRPGPIAQAGAQRVEDVAQPAVSSGGKKPCPYKSHHHKVVTAVKRWVGSAFGMD